MSVDERFVRSVFEGCVLQSLLELRADHSAQQIERLWADPRIERALIHDELRDLCAQSEPQRWREAMDAAFMTAKLALKEVTALAPAEFNLAAKHVVTQLDHLAGIQEDIGTTFFTNTFFRAFDCLDELWGIDYTEDTRMNWLKPETSERIYAGSGIGVQSSYITLLTTLRRLKRGSRVMDLGSGFGRMGLLWGLLDERSEFDGYEFVPHRVHNAQAAAERAGIADRVRFIAQDLADPEFRIPRADVYYLYDPFTASTYQSVLNQIIAHARTAPTTVITKGGATRWFSAAIDGGAWSGPVSFDGANLALFQNWSV